MTLLIGFRGFHVSCNAWPDVERTGEGNAQHLDSELSELRLLVSLRGPGVAAFAQRGQGGTTASL